ncbi:MAG TPA: phosphatidylserine/phosphatidylglycerophosphate/cardiolipin synthase family protein [Candidatus Dormibacteraeota bacterium]|nr:phosphatidylserine/phosphatidylglycerophosphate/cardiolipin synthase family protein [Candidatus Dormibacteraeota bacterium]
MRDDVDPAARHVPFAESGSYPVRDGNAVRPLVDGEPAFRRICEAVETARHSVWVTVAFLRPGFLMPDGRGSFFDLLDGAAARGLDVRVLFWGLNPESSHFGPGVFSGTPEQREVLAARGAGFSVRWDRAHGPYCQHQKSWLVDAGQQSETAFVGGINLNPRAVVSPGHVGEDQVHDIYLEVTGPAATDVHHNFVQRWNEASDRACEDGVWGPGGGDQLPFPTCLTGSRGPGLVQIQRTVHAGRYRVGEPAPGGVSFEIAAGERTILDQYLLAIGAARRSIYIENQALEVAEIVLALDQALERGVGVVVLVPSEPEDQARAARGRPEMRSFDDRMRALGRYEHFALAGIAGPTGRGDRADVYVHAKVMLVDDAWATIGSCNLHRASLFANSELNASFWDPEAVRALRCELLAEHLDLDTAGLDDVTALGEYRRIARENRSRRDLGDAGWQGLAFSLDPATYCR